MKVNWIIENYSKENSFKELTEAVESLGYPLIKIGKEDYTKKVLSPFLDCQDYKHCIVVNGTIKMCRLINNEINHFCKPVLYCDWPKYKCSAYYSHFGSYLFNDKYCLMSLAELERQKFDVWGHYGKDALIFIRPDSGEKDFQAGLLDLLDLGRFLEINKDCLHDLVLVSTPKNIRWEGRFIVSRNKEIIAFSTYRFQNQVTSIPTVPPKAKALCNEILNKTNYIPDSVYCLDLCEDNDGNFWLLELTSFSSAGLYASNKVDIVKKVSEIAWEDFKNYNKEIQ